MPDDASNGASPMLIPSGPYGAISGTGFKGVGVEADAVPLSYPCITFSWLASMRSNDVKSTDCLLLDPFLGVCFCTRNGVPVVPLMGLPGAEQPLEWTSCFTIGELEGSFCPDLDPEAEVLHRQVCFLGMAAVTAAQEHGLEAGWGHELKGRPGLRTGTMRRSLAWLHFVERWPRIQGSLSPRCQYRSSSYETHSLHYL